MICYSSYKILKKMRMEDYFMPKRKRLKKRIRRSIKCIILLTLLVWGIHRVYYYFTNIDTAEAEAYSSVESESDDLVEKEGKEDSSYEVPEKLRNSTDPVIQELINLSSKHTAAQKILNNVNAYPEELLKLAAKKEETLSFVADYVDHSEETGDSKISVKKDYSKGKIPLFIQWDKRWGYYKYGNDYMAINGCGPTSLAMVIVGLKGDTDINPKVVAEYSNENGYLVDGVGTSWTLMSNGAKHFGLRSEEIPLDPKAIKTALKSGNPIIASMNPGQFTDSGHFIVLSGLTEDGKVIVNDPDSKMRSNKTWDIDVFMNETANLWEFSVE